MVIFAVIFACVNSFLQPVWFYENNYHTYRSFYEEPRNTIETVFVGASMTLFGFSPTEMYGQNGICAYNLASTSQPMMMSYFWVKEANRLHGETLDTVVLDVSMLRRTPKEEDLRKALDGMDKASPVKKEAIEALSDTTFDYISYQFPIIGYHDRWASIDYTDFVKYDTEPESYARGYFMEFSRIFDMYSIEEISVPTQMLNENADPSEFEKESLFYLNKLIDFCDQEDIKLVLCKTPSPSNWSSNDHNGVQEIADSYSLPFLDFEVNPLLEEIDYCPPLESKDLNKHLNYYGAMKLTHWMGNFLVEQCGNRDVRGDEKYVHLETQLKEYNEKVTKLAEATMDQDVGDFITKVAQAKNYTMLISVRDEASASLTAAQRMAFSNMGLTKLATLGYRDSYLAVVTDGKVEYEQLERTPGRFVEDVDHYKDQLERKQEEAVDEEPADFNDDDEVEIPDEEEEEPAVNLDDIEENEWDNDAEEPVEIVYNGAFADGTSYTLTSGGNRSGNTSSCLIGETEYSPNKRGFNIVVYDNDSHRVVYTAFFDTFAESQRENPNIEQAVKDAKAEGVKYSRMTDNMKKLYRYMRRMDYGVEAKTLKGDIGSGGLLQYLQHFSRKGLIVLIAVKDEATMSLSDEARAALVDMGLTEMVDLGYQESYCAAIEDGEVVDQVRGYGEEPVILERRWYTLKSGGYNSGNVASIVIDDNGYSADYANNARGFNIVVYNPKLDIVVDETSFDSCANSVDIVW